MSLLSYSKAVAASRARVVAACAPPAGRQLTRGGLACVPALTHGAFSVSALARSFSTTPVASAVAGSSGHTGRMRTTPALHERAVQSTPGETLICGIPAAVEALSVTLAQAAARLPPSRNTLNIYAQGGSGTPTPLLEALPEASAALRAAGLKVQLLHLHLEGPAPHLTAGHREHESNPVLDRSLFVGANAREAVNAPHSNAVYVSFFLGDISSRLFLNGRVPVDVAFLHVSPADRHGFHSTGTSADITYAASRVAGSVIALVNENMPRTGGDTLIHESQLDAAIVHNAPLYTLPPYDPVKAAGTAEDRIGKLIAEELVADGATIQMGIGGIPQSVTHYLKHHRRLGLHSEMISDGVVDLIEAGVITNEHKHTDKGKSLCTFAIGTPRLYDWLHENPSMLVRHAGYVNDTSVIQAQPRMTAINSCVEIDLTGQVSSETIAGRIHSGVGGQIDFLRGAALSENGAAILALPSRTHKGIPRIVPRLSPGMAVTTTRAHVNYVVTENGIADLCGLSLQERAAALIGLAHEGDREALTAEAKKMGLM